MKFVLNWLRIIEINYLYFFLNTVLYGLVSLGNNPRYNKIYKTLSKLITLKIHQHISFPYIKSISKNYIFQSTNLLPTKLDLYIMKHSYMYSC